MISTRSQRIAIITALLLGPHAQPGRAQPIQLGPTDVLEPGACLALAPAGDFDFASLIGSPAELLADRLLEALQARSIVVTEATPLIAYSTRA